MAVREQETIILDPDLDAKVAELIGQLGAALPVAEKVAEVARALAPVESGLYRDGIKAERTGRGARVIASDEKSSWVEFGIPSHNQPAQFVLRRAVDACGLKFVKGKKR